MEDLKENKKSELNKENKELKDTGTGWIIISFLIPLVGIILFFTQLGRVKNPIYYLMAAIVGFSLMVILTN